MNSRMEAAQTMRASERTETQDISKPLVERLNAYASFEQLCLLVELFTKNYSEEFVKNNFTHPLLVKTLTEVITTLNHSVVENTLHNFKVAHLTQLEENIRSICDHWTEFAQLEKPLTNNFDPQSSGILAMFIVSLAKLKPLL